MDPKMIILFTLQWMCCTFRQRQKWATVNLKGKAEIKIIKIIKKTYSFRSIVYQTKI